MTFAEAMLAMLLISVFIFAAGKISQILTMPLCVGKNSKLVIVLCVNGDEPALERTIRSLKYLSSFEKDKIDVFIVDNGMDEGTKKTAELLVRNEAGLKLCTIKDLCLESLNEEGIHRDKGSCGYGNIPE